MTNPTPQVFEGITPAHYAKLAESARTAGIEMSGNNRRTSKLGITVEWNYSDEKQELVLTCVETPFFVNNDDVDARIRSLVNQALKS